MRADFARARRAEKFIAAYARNPRQNACVVLSIAPLCFSADLVPSNAVSLAAPLARRCERFAHVADLSRKPAQQVRQRMDRRARRSTAAIVERRFFGLADRR